MDAYSIVTTIIAMVILAAGIVRYRRALRPSISFEQIESLALQVLAHFRETAPMVGHPQSVDYYFREVLPLHPDTSNQVLVWMKDRGWVALHHWGVLQRVAGIRPQISLTNNGWEKATVREPTIHVQDSPGASVNNGSGIQSVVGNTVSATGLNASDLSDLAYAIRLDLVGLDNETRPAAAQVVDTLEAASESGNTENARVQSSIKWIQSRLNDATSQVVSRSIWEATTEYMRFKGLL
ncbi:hypothetical protein ACMHYS_29725 [Rhodococcus erythropolis]|uniref:hypothetical protein n=1 Tax=Rhodococcus erythropolis TaxID=1833 RepID=UPI0039C29790